jgi:hypothetical protein
MNQHSDAIVSWYTDILGDDMPTQCNYDLKPLFQGDGPESIGFASQLCGATQVVFSTYIGGLHATNDIELALAIGSLLATKSQYQTEVYAAMFHSPPWTCRRVFRLTIRNSFESWFALDESWRILLAFGA